MSSPNPRDFLQNPEDERSGILTLYHPGKGGADMPESYLLQKERFMDRVPRPPHFSPPQQTNSEILYYDDLGWPGVRVKDIIKNTASIAFPDQPVMAHYGWRSTVINLEWPGFIPTSASSNPMSARVDVCPNGNHITRLELAREICFLLFDFYERCGKSPVAPGWESWSLDPDSQGIRIFDLVLLSVHYYRRVWVPEFYVLERGTRRLPP